MMTVAAGLELFVRAAGHLVTAVTMLVHMASVGAAGSKQFCTCCCWDTGALHALCWGYINCCSALGCLS
jgi:hypothetical protein